MQLRLVQFFVLFIFCKIVEAQYSIYARDYFLFPIKPGQRNFLSGNMGELRTNHFHGGLDIKTDQKTGLPVYAAADGYVSRIAVQHRGYGNTIYITHPNGLTTVYAHLEWFNKEISDFITSILYEQQCNEIDYTLIPNVIKVKKGDTIAASGNTGSSGGPHLHWEIRDEEERLLNPLFFEFNEIVDRQNPIVNKIALRTLDINSRVEGEFGRVEFIPQKTLNQYELKYPIHVEGVIGLEIVSYDKMDDVANLYGVSLIEMYLDNKIIFTHDIQKIAFDENPYINSHIDYETALTKRNYFQKCYVADGNLLNTYKNMQNSGRIVVNDTLLHEVKVKITDAYRNYTTLVFKLKKSKNIKPKEKVVYQKKRKVKAIPYLKHTEYENTLKIHSFGNESDIAFLYFKKSKVELNPSYSINNENVYLWDLRKKMPDSVVVGKSIHHFIFKEVIPSKNTINYTSENIDLIFARKTIFDTLFLDLEYKNKVFTIEKPTLPMFSPVTVVLKPDFEIVNKDKYSVYTSYGGGKRGKYAGGVWQGNNIKFSTKVLGDFVIEADSIPPKVAYFKTVGKSKYFKIGDADSGLAYWYAYLNGKFLLMHYEAKYNVIFSDPNYHLPLKGELLIGAIDNMGNKVESKFKL